MLALLAAVALAQDPGALIEQLRSDDPSVREDAVRGLRALGTAAKEALQKKERDGDPEVAAQVRQLLGRVALLERLTPRLRKAHPGIEDRLNGEGDAAWTRAFLEADGAMQPEDVAALVERALKGASAEQLAGVIQHVALLRVRSAAPLLLPYLRDGREPDVSGPCADALAALEATEAIPHLLDLARDKNPERRVTSLRGLVAFSDSRCQEAIAQLVGDADPSVRGIASTSLYTPHQMASPEPFVALLRRPDVEVQKAALRVLAYVERAADDVLPLVASEDPDVRQLAQDFVRWARPPKGRPRLLEIARTAPPRLAAEMVDVLGSMREPSVEPLAAAWLTHESPTLRACGARALGRVGCENRVVEITALLTDPESEVRAAAADALYELRVDGAVPSVEKLLVDASPKVRVAAVHALGRLSKPADAARKIVPVLGDSDAEVRKAALEALYDASARDALPDVARRVKDADGDVRSRAWWVLESLEAREVLRDVLPLLKSESYEEVLSFVREVRAREAVPEVVELLGDGHEQVVCDALETLVELGARDAVPSILPLLQHASGDVREEAVEALGRLGAAGARDALVRLLEDEMVGVRRRAAKALGEVGDRACLAALARRLEDSDFEVAEAAANAMGEIDDGEAARLASDALRAGREQTRRAAALALGLYHRPESEDVLRAALKDAEPGVRATALRALAATARDRAAADVRACLRDEDPGVRDAAISVVSGFKMRDATADLLALTEDPYASVREQARGALVALGVRDVAPQLLAALRSEDRPYSRVGLAVKLAEVGAPEAARELARLSREPRDAVWQVAIFAIGSHRLREAIPDLLLLARDWHPQRRTAALDALLELEVREAVPIALELVTQEGWVSVASVLARLPGGHAEVETLLSHARPDVRAAAVRALAFVDARISGATIAKLLEDPSPIVVLAALDVVAELRIVEAKAPVRRVMREQADAGAECAAALAAIDDRESAGAIASLLKDRVGYTRAAAASALGSLGATETAPSLEGVALNDWHRDSRLAAMKALCHVGSRKGASMLVAEADADPDVELSPVNAAMAPEAWRRLNESLGVATEGALRSVLERVARDVGLRLELPRLTPVVRDWLESVTTVAAGQTVVSSLEDLVVDWSFEWAVDGDRLRVMQRRDALAFWRERLK